MTYKDIHLTRVCLAVLVFATFCKAEAAVPLDGQTNTDSATAFQSGIDAGNQAFDPNTAKSTTTAGSLPGYNENPPNTEYVNSSNPAAAEAAGQAKQSTSDAYNIGVSSKQGVDQDVSLTTGTDPIFQQSSPSSNIGRQFSGCTDTVGTAAGALSTQTCTATPPLSLAFCSRTLAVDVLKEQSCQLGANLTTINTYTLILPRKGWYGRSSSTVICGPALDGTHQVNVSVQTFWGSGSFSFMLNAATPGTQWSGVVGGIGFTFTSLGCDANFICTLQVQDGYQTWTGTFPLSRVYYTQTDTWTDACLPFAERVVP
jgi:hypothetical protein